ncbi:MAG: peptidoglycan-binding protein [Clostridiales bacterium]|jgi:peptidoglycan hydrolase-like protein with peptidoglycan-binding domain|nr:peptidoglycan-binding protein [Clostridiales bacterium]
MGTGYLQVQVRAGEAAIPVAGAAVTITGQGGVMYDSVTDGQGMAGRASFDAPDKSLQHDPNFTGLCYSKADVTVDAGGFSPRTVFGLMIFDGETMIMPVDLTPIPADDYVSDPNPRIGPNDEMRLPEHSLANGGQHPQEGPDEQAMGRILREVTVPHTIRVHLGKPAEYATNVYVKFKEYLKNVCTYEIYPDWPANTLEANILCQTSLALNRIYTEWYPSQGYAYDITSSTWNDQNYVYAHVGPYTSKISAIVDRVFNNFARRVGQKGPYFTEYCDGRTATCPGLKQWGSLDLGNKGYTPLQILKYYYGNDIEIAETSNIDDVEASYPGSPLKEGMRGSAVKQMQDQLNRIRVAYRNIPQISSPNGYFGPDTTAAVKAFKAAADWSLPSASSGAVDKSTWYNISYAYYAVKKLGELGSEGEIIGVGSIPPNSTLGQGSKGTEAGKLQFLINAIAEYYPEVPSVIMDYSYGPSTANAVRAFEQAFGLNPDGIAGPQVWNKLYEVYWSLKDSGLLPGSGGGAEYPGFSLTIGSSGPSVRKVQSCLNNIGSRYPGVGGLTEDGVFGIATRSAVITFQSIFGLTQDGIVGPAAWAKIMSECQSGGSAPGSSYPGYSLSMGTSGDYVLKVQQCLNRIRQSQSSIPWVTEDGIFGSGTRAAVIAFQRINGLSQDGIVGPATWATIMERCQSANAPAYPGYSISAGSSGDYVLRIQRCLNRIRLSYASIPWVTEDGAFGGRTQTAVKAFQSVFGLTQDGIVGAATWQAIFSRC